MAVTRDTHEGIGPNGESVRIYNYEGSNLPSVTSILKSRDEDMSNLHKWQDKHDGEGDNAFHEHWFWYSRHRGTLAHYRGLSKLDPDLEWSRDEAQSVWALGNVDKQNDPEDHPEVHDSCPREVLYSVVKYLGGVETWGEFYDVYPPYRDHDYYSEGIIDRKDRDVAFFTEAFERMCHKLDITEDNALAVEEKLFDLEYGFAGQCDLVLEYPNGDIALADLKTKKGAFAKEKMQGAAYATAVINSDEIPVDHFDRTEVWCINPDTGKYAIYSEDADASPLHTSAYWNKSWQAHWSDFEELLDNYEYEM